MSIVKQWLVDPANTETKCYITENPEVARKRANKGDYVVELERTGKPFMPASHVPYHSRVHPDPKPQPKDEDDEL